ncbi:MAG: site-specific DNA-methyltransferase, partial [Candidatus Aenigmatarchaeota archaeon]
MLSEWIDKIIHGDALEVMPSIPSEIADVVFWDPPYYLQLPKGKKLRRWKSLTDVSGVDEDWDKFSSFQEY